MRPSFIFILIFVYIIGCNSSSDKRKGISKLELKKRNHDTGLTSTDSSEISGKNDGSKVFFYCYEDYPEFPGGEGALIDFLTSHTFYPRSAIRDRVEGRVYVKFVIEKDGSVSNVTIARGVRNDLDEAALKIVRQMPDWKPGRLRGELIRISYIVPVNYRLDDLEAGKIKKENTTSVKIYPNPTTGEVNMEVSEWIPDLTYAFFNSNGQLLKRGLMSSQSEIINISEFSQGLYMVRLSSESNRFVWSGKVIKK